MSRLLCPVTRSRAGSFARWSLALLLAAVPASFESSALAQGAAPAGPAAPSPEAVKTATTAFKDGAQLFGEKKYALALERFQVSYDTVPSPNSRLYVARCQAAMGKLLEAYRTFEATIVEAELRAKTEPKYVPTRDSAMTELGDLSKKIAVVTVTVENAQESTRLKIGGAPVPREEWGKPMPLDPGSIEVLLETQGMAPVKEQLQVAKGEAKSVTVGVPRPEDMGGKIPDLPPGEEEDSGGGGVGLWPGVIVAGGVGVAGMVMFAVGGSMSMSTESELVEACGENGPCPADFDTASLVDRGNTEQTIANVGLIVGGVGLAAAATMLIIELASGGSSDEAAPPPSVSLDVGPGYVGVSGRF